MDDQCLPIDLCSRTVRALHHDVSECMLTVCANGFFKATGREYSSSEHAVRVYGLSVRVA